MPAWPEMMVTDEERFLSWAHSGNRNVFLTGAGGVGKSTLTRQFISECQAQSKSVAVTASTGVAAILIGGCTIHSWAGIELGPRETEPFGECADRLLARPWKAAIRAHSRVRNARAVLIDEISMLPGRLFSFLDYWFRRLRENDQPFGGCQMILVGDFLQLCPVRKDPRNPYDWTFQSEAWSCIDKTINLKTIRRQTDGEFIAALSAVRVGELRATPVRLLRSRVLENPPRDIPRLMTHNLMVEKWCRLMLSDIEAETIVFEAITRGEPAAVEKLARNILAPARLELKPGALVMHLVNKTHTAESGEDVYVVNGALGIVERIEPDVPGENGPGCVIIRLRETGHHIAVQRHSYSWSHQRPGEGGPEYCQLPLRLAWALTIHKAQGMTLDRAHIDVRSAREPGQTYVAFSRVRTLDGLSLKAWPSGAFVSPQAIRFYQSLEPCPGPDYKPAQASQVPPGSALEPKASSGQPHSSKAPVMPLAEPVLPLA